MNKFFITFIFLLLTCSSFAQQMTCLDKLLPFNRHSGLHQLTNDEWNQKNNLSLDADVTESALKFLINTKLLCRNNEVVIKVRPTCSLVLPDINQSNVCFAFTNLGYFIISKDNAKNFNFIFTRDRRFND